MQALEALIDAANVLSAPMFADAITALRTALEQPEQEPVPDALGHIGFQEWWDAVADGYEVNDFKKMRRAWNAALKHEAPPAAQRPWVGLMPEDKKKIATAAGCTEDDDGHIVTEIFRLAEAKLKERNT
jgi:hypothetical protein